MKKTLQIMLLTAFSTIFFACSKQEPLELFFQSDIAASKNTSAEFTIKFENTAPDQKSEFSSKVWVAKQKGDGLGLSFRIEETNNTTITFDGTRFIVVDNANKQISSSSNPQMASEFAMNLGQSFYMIIDDKLDTAEIRNSSKDLKYIGTADVNGETCYEVSQKAAGHGEYNVENHYFFSKEDKLMKKYTSKISDKNNKVVQSIQFTINNLKLNQKISPDKFTQVIDTVNYKYMDLDKSHDMGGQGMNEGQEMEGHGEMGGHGDMEGHGHGEMEGQTNGLLQKGTLAPDWSLLDSKGSKVTLKNLKGKVVVLDFWATWCNPCKQVMPVIQKIHNKYKSQNVLVYGVNAWERGDAKKFMSDNKYTYGLLLKGDDVAMQYKVEGIPTLYVIDKNGKVVFAESGANSDLEKKLETAIKSAL